MDNFPVKVSEKPEFGGCRKDGVLTMAHQAVLLGKLSVQIEMPISVRKVLANDNELR